MTRLNLHVGKAAVHKSTGLKKDRHHLTPLVHSDLEVRVRKTSRPVADSEQRPDRTRAQRKQRQTQLPIARTQRTPNCYIWYEDQSNDDVQWVHWQSGSAQWIRGEVDSRTRNHFEQLGPRGEKRATTVRIERCLWMRHVGAKSWFVPSTVWLKSTRFHTTSE